MRVPLRVNFQNMDASSALEKRVREKIAKLEKIYTIISGEVTVRCVASKKHQGRLYSVRIDIKAPGGEFVVSHRPGAGKKPKRHEEVYAAMNDAFLAIEKQIRSFKDVQKNELRLHKPVFHPGMVVQIDLKKGFGYIETGDGETIYFHEHAVQANRFGELKIGRRVRFSIAEDEGRKGPQANAVRVRATPASAPGASRKGRAK